MTAFKPPRDKTVTFWGGHGVVPGSHYDIFAGGQPINFGVTNDPNNVPPPSAKPGVYNLEVIVNSSGTGGFSTAPGYQGLAILSTDGRTLTALHGSYDVTDAGNNDLIILGDGNESVLGATGDTLQGGSGASQFIDAHLGHQSVLGGSAGNELIYSGAGDTIRGGSGGK